METKDLKKSPGSRKGLKRVERKQVEVKDKFTPKADFSKRRNDIKWRTGDPVMTKLVGNLPFGLAAGLAQSINLTGDPAQTANIIEARIPGIFSVRTRLTVGSTAGTDVYNTAPNLCFRKVYSYVRHANSGSKNYENSDLGIYFCAIGQALGLLGWLQRAYAVINKYSATNRYQPKFLVEMMGLNYEDMIANQPQLKYLIAWMGRAIGALAFPKMPYFEACYNAYKYIVRDNDSPKEQFYMLDSAGFGVYDPVLTTTGGGIKFTTTNPWGLPSLTHGAAAVHLTFVQLYAYVHEIMDVLLSDEDCGIISGDILKAYKDGGLFVPEAFGDYDPIVKDDELLQQIHNAHCIDEYYTSLTDIRQVPGGTNQAPYVTNTITSNNGHTSAASVAQYTFIDAFSKEPEADEVVNCLVLNPQYRLSKQAIGFDDVDLSFDLHLPVAAYMQRHPIPGTLFGVIFMGDAMNRGKVGSGIAAGSFCLTNFDWHPIVFAYTRSSGEDLFEAIGDIQNSRFFEYEVGQRIHENSMLSLLNFQENNFVK